MLRSGISLGLLVVLGVGTWGALGSSSKANDDAVAQAVRPRDRARALREQLDRPVTLEFDAGSLKEFLGYLQDRYNVTILVDETAFKAAGQAEIKLQEVKVDKVAGIRLRSVLRLVLTQIQADFLEQDGQVVVVPRMQVDAGSLFNQAIDTAFEKMPLAEALQDLAALSGVSVVLDPSVAEQARTPITATLSHSSLIAAVRVLANMAGLKTVTIDKVLYVTSFEKADELVDR
jgi:hypothetical protein